MTYESDNVLRAVLNMAGGPGFGVAYAHVARLCEYEIDAVKKECELLEAEGFIRKTSKRDNVMITESGLAYASTYHRMQKPT